VEAAAAAVVVPQSIIALAKEMAQQEVQED
jgi:hypothetical protein